MDIIPESSLKMITGVQENRIWSFLHKLINCSVDPSNTSHAVLFMTFSAGPRRGARLFESIPNNNIYFSKSHAPTNNTITKSMQKLNKGQEKEAKATSKVIILILTSQILSKSRITTNFDIDCVHDINIFW